MDPLSKEDAKYIKNIINLYFKFIPILISKTTIAIYQVSVKICTYTSVISNVLIRVNRLLTFNFFLWVYVLYTHNPFLTFNLKLKMQRKLMSIIS